MTWDDLKRLPSRVRLARQLLREYEADRAPWSFEEGMAKIAAFADLLDSGHLSYGERISGVTAWREAVLAKAGNYANESDVA